MKLPFLRLLFSFFILISFLYSKDIKISLKKLNLNPVILKTTKGESNFILPIPSRWDVKRVLLHLVYSPSKNLIKQRSSLAVFVNGIVVFSKKLDPNIDIYKEDIEIPIDLLTDYNKVKIIAYQHYCMNCCENEASSELWTEINPTSSFIKIKYKEKNIENSLIYFSHNILDKKQIIPFKFGILLQNKTNELINLASKLSSYIGKSLEYRPVYINALDKIVANEDIFLIGTKNYVANLLRVNLVNKGNVFVIRNPLNPKKVIIVITADNVDKLKEVLDSFISIDKKYLLGKTLIPTFNKIPTFKPYDTPNLIPIDKKVYFSDLGYRDFKFFNPFYYYDVHFNIAPDLFRFNKDKFIVHLFYNYGAGIRKDSVINIFLNGKFITSLKLKKEYGSILEDVKLKIPVYLLVPGDNKLTIQYAFMPTGSGFCTAKNYLALQGTVFADKSYIELPNLPHWVDMPHLEFFTTTAYPFSIYPDLSDTQIFVSDKDLKTLSSLYTLMAYIGEKILVPSFRVRVVFSKEDLLKNKNIIAIGRDIPSILFKNLPIQINDNKIKLKVPIIKKITTLIQKKLLGENNNINTILEFEDKLNNELILTLGQSPFNSNKVVMLFISNNLDKLNKGIDYLFDPKVVSKIKGDLSIIENNKTVISAKVGKVFYIGHLPFIDYILFKFGYNIFYYILGSILILIILVIVIKKLLDYREKRRLKGEI